MGVKMRSFSANSLDLHGASARPYWRSSSAGLPILLALVALLAGGILPAPAHAQTVNASPAFSLTFENANYTFYNITTNQTEAEALCISTGGHLASIHTTKEDQFFYDACVNKLGVSQRQYGGCWIGLVDPVEGNYTWTDSTPFEYDIWDRFNNDFERKTSKQPDGDRPGFATEDCTAMVVNPGAPPIGYKDITCNSTSFNPVCKKAISAEPGAAAPAQSKKKKSGIPLGIIVGAAMGGIAIIAIIGACIFVYYKYGCALLAPPGSKEHQEHASVTHAKALPNGASTGISSLASNNTANTLSNLDSVVTTTHFDLNEDQVRDLEKGQDKAMPLRGASKAAAATGKSPWRSTKGGLDVIRDAPDNILILDAGRGSTHLSSKGSSYRRPPPSLPAVQGNPVTAAPAGAGAVAAAGLLPACLSLAGGILANADRVVANNARCMQLVSRISAMKPLLLDLQGKLLSRGQQGEDELRRLDPMLLNIREVLADVSACITTWTSERASTTLAVLRNLMAAAWYQDRFVELNVNLSAALMDLNLALQIPMHHLAQPVDRSTLEAEAAVDTAKDLDGLVQELVGSGEEGGPGDKWGALGPDDKDKLQEIFEHHGLDLGAAVRNARMAKLDDKVRRLMIPSSDIKLEHELGSGGFGTVYQGVWRLVTPVAVKKLDVGTLTERTKADIRREAYIHSEAHNHPNVCQLYGIVLEAPSTCMMVMELHRRGNLLQLLRDYGRALTWRHKIQISLEAASGLAHLHSKKIVHGDVKPSNFLIKDDGRVAVADFGLSAVSALTLTSATRTSALRDRQAAARSGAEAAEGAPGERSMGASGDDVLSQGSSGLSLWYSPPEVLANQSNRKGPEGDVYAFGMVMLEIATRDVPFVTGDFEVVMCMVLSGKRPSIPEGVPGAYRDLIERCWAQGAGERPSFDEIVGVLYQMVESGAGA